MACQPSQSSNESTEESTYKNPDHLSAALTLGFEAHGSYEMWSQMKTLSYQRGDESTITNLHNRKIRLESEERVIGFDGEEVWVTPDSLDASRARFYHNLYFYFYAMPFVVGDPGAIYEEVESRQLMGKEYKGIKVSYQENVGDAPDDNYILWVDPDTNRMEWLMYTVTYRSGEPSESYSLIKYDGWNEFNGLLLPTTLQWYTFEGDTVGEARGNGALFENILLDNSSPADSLFEMPEGAQIAPLNSGI